MTPTRTIRRLTVTSSCALALVAATLSAGPSSAAQGSAGPSSAGPSSAGPSSEPRPGPERVESADRERLADRLAQSQQRQERRAAPPLGGELDAVLAQMERDGAVGVTARVETPRARWQGADGVRERGAAAPARPGDTFRAASNTKPMVAVLVLQQVESGAWSLGTTVDEVLPGMLPGHGDVTVEQLLSHTSGLQTGTEVSIAANMEDGSYRSFFEAIGDDYSDFGLVSVASALTWQTEGQITYSNAGYVLLGMMLEAQTGTEIAALLEERVFGPAGMSRTSFPTAPGTSRRFLVGAASTEEGWFSTAGFNPEAFSSAGAVVSTSRDLNRFTEALVDGTLLEDATVQEMFTPRGDLGLFAYGLGVMRVSDPCTPKGQPQRYLYGHNGGAFGTVSWMLTSPDGRRQVSLGVTGRYYQADPQAPQPYDDIAALTELVEATC